ncbi:MAG: ectonucleotide pyrophosphatase/phosphodiesterase [Leptospiraceae bacterium]|nr:ectonucleotide pyrophosphatase/phosphodiesterase [Leptospiraceae bacterium]
MHLKKKLLILSIDGLPSYYFDKDSPFIEKMPNLLKLADVSTFSRNVVTTTPTLTYPAHTSMITGVMPAEHGIYFNSPIDYHSNIKGDWYWFYEDIRVKTLLDFAKEGNLKTASVYWPVTVGADIDYNIPQFWKNKTDYDAKFLRALSYPPELYKTLEQATGTQVGEFTGDREKILFAIETWKKYKPHIMLVYTTDLDSAHHEKGVYSKEAGEVLEKIDKLVKKLIDEINLFQSPELGFMIVSDHGFKKVSQICYPNQVFLTQSTSDKWKYRFKTNGGMAVLVKNQKERKLKKEELEKIKSQIMENCPGAYAVYEGEEFEYFKKNFFPNALMFLYTYEEMTFSESQGKWFQILEKSFSNHGFPPDDPEMKTIHLFYPPLKGGRHLRHVTEALEISCEWLEIHCKIGEKK